MSLHRVVEGVLNKPMVLYFDKINMDTQYQLGCFFNLVSVLRGGVIMVSMHIDTYLVVKVKNY